MDDEELLNELDEIEAQELEAKMVDVGLMLVPRCDLISY